MLHPCPLIVVSENSGRVLSCRLLASLLALFLFCIAMQDAIAGDGNTDPGTGSPLLALHADGWTPSFKDIFLAKLAGPRAVQLPGALKPEFSPDVTTYTAGIKDSPGAMVIVVSAPGTTVRMLGAAADGTALQKELSINQIAESIEIGELNIESAVVTAAGFIDIPPGKNIVTIQIDMEDGSPTRTYVIKLTR